MEEQDVLKVAKSDMGKLSSVVFNEDFAHKLKTLLVPFSQALSLLEDNLH